MIYSQLKNYSEYIFFSKSLYFIGSESVVKSKELTAKKISRNVCVNLKIVINY